MKTDNNNLVNHFVFIQGLVCIALAFVFGFVLCRSMVRVEDVADRGDHYEVSVTIWGLCELHEIEKL